MSSYSSSEKKCAEILEKKGGRVADEATNLLLDDLSLEHLRPAFEHTSRIWRDPLSPSLLIIACEEVGGEMDDGVHSAALSMTLIGMGLNHWDDIIDNTLYKGVIPSVQGKFGTGTALMIGGLAVARGFLILREIKTDEVRQRAIGKLIWNYCTKLSKAEVLNSSMKKSSDSLVRNKLSLFEMQSINLETSMKIGASLGKGSREHIECLGSYGRYLGTILKMAKDLRVSLNLTLELSEKLRSGALPFAVLWAKKHSGDVRKFLSSDFCAPHTLKKLVKAMLDSGAMENTLSIIDRLTKKAERQVSKFGNSESKELLYFFVTAQQHALVESLSKLSC